MPIYEYQCGECQKRHEALQKISDAPLVECPGCGQPALKKLISAAGFRLKGGGWYETDFKTGNKKQLASGESAEKNGSANKDTARDGGEKSKPDAKGGDSKEPAKTAAKSDSGSSSAAGQSS
ncbi:MAG: zinc ribbon domain-containing protein [Gammaproteobacteria bacterium]